MPVSKNQSAIREVRDQLFADTADGRRLNIVGANLGLDRPAFGFSDDNFDLEFGKPCRKSAHGQVAPEITGSKSTNPEMEPALSHRKNLDTGMEFEGDYLICYNGHLSRSQ